MALFHPTRAVGGRGEHLPFIDKYTDPEEGKGLVGLSPMGDKAEQRLKLGPVWNPGHQGVAGGKGKGKLRKQS